MKIYMAGKIDETDWRQEIVGRNFTADAESDSTTWRESWFKFWGGTHEYVGPFFVGGKAHDRVEERTGAAN